MSGVLLCRVDEIDDPGTREFKVGSGDWPLRGFLVRCRDRVVAYENWCPHAGHPLNLREDEFLTPDRQLIQCRSHGALFDIDGQCIAGPCSGRSLRPLSICVENGYVVLTSPISDSQ